jgi:signal peptidase
VIRVRRITHHVAVTAAVVLTLGLLLVEVGISADWWRLTPVLSGSMSPGMPSGSLAIVRPVPTSAIGDNDVVVYEAPVPDHRVLAHRVIEIDHDDEGTVLRTKGDANTAPDPWKAVVHGSTAWKVTASLDGVGWLGVVLMSALFRSVLLVAVGAILLRPVIGRAWRGPTRGPALVTPVA